MDVVSDDRVVGAFAGDVVLRQIEAQGLGPGLLVDRCSTSLGGAIVEGEKGADWGLAVKRASPPSLLEANAVKGELVVRPRSDSSSGLYYLARTRTGESLRRACTGIVNVVRQSFSSAGVDFSNLFVTSSQGSGFGRVSGTSGPADLRI